MISEFKKNGFLIEKIFTDREIKSFERSFIEICKMQMNKINISSTSGDIQQIVKKLWKKNPNALDECCLMSRNSEEGHKLAANKKIFEISKKTFIK